MGLDITAYRRAEFIATMDVEAWENDYYFSDDPAKKQTTIAGHWEGAFADRAAPIVENGVYRYAEKLDVRAGSYSGYNDWRDWLSWTMLGIPARQVWEERDVHKGRPFYELIDFSDAEGILGAPVCAKLAADFAAHQARADARGQDHEGWYARKYGEWRRAFELATDGGFVEFH